MLFLFAAFARSLQLGLDLTKKTAETAAATGAVMTTRLGLLNAAAADPLRADHAELGRMVPEKIVAFSQAGGALAREWLALNRSAGDAVLHMTRMMMSGRPPQPRDVVALAEHSTRHANRVVKVTTQALAPVHRKATANAKRLARKRVHVATRKSAKPATQKRAKPATRKRVGRR